MSKKLSKICTQPFEQHPANVGFSPLLFFPAKRQCTRPSKMRRRKKIGNELLRSRWRMRFQMMADSIRSAISYFLRFDFFQNLLFTVDDFCLQKRLVAFIPVVNFDFFPVILASGIVYGFERCAAIERAITDSLNTAWNGYFCK